MFFTKTLFVIAVQITALFAERINPKLRKECTAKPESEILYATRLGKATTAAYKECLPIIKKLSFLPNATLIFVFDDTMCLAVQRCKKFVMEALKLKTGFETSRLYKCVEKHVRDYWISLNVISEKDRIIVEQFMICVARVSGNLEVFRLLVAYTKKIVGR